MIRLLIISLLAIVVLVGCSTPAEKPKVGEVEKQPANTGRYSMLHDKMPKNPPDVSRVPDAQPRFEPYSRAGNFSPYQVFGQTYHVMPTSQGYREQGFASWYGEKFHGHLTSNGEVYDMYEMTAAHKSLPLPTYARVTNLENGRTVIVRINDRGPFHEGRIIDLSYAAAYRLDIVRTGTGRVEVEAITLEPQPEIQFASTGAPLGMSTVVSRDNSFLQVGAYSTEETAREVQQRVRSLVKDLPVVIRPSAQSSRTLYRVQVGPLQRQTTLDSLIATLKAAGLGAPQLVDL